jgi:hypothetical protein
MPHGYQPHTSFHTFPQHPTINTHWPLPREQAHRAIPLQKLASITHHPLPNHPPDIPNHATDRRTWARRSGLVIHQHGLNTTEFRDEESLHPLRQNSNPKTILKRPSATVRSRSVMRLHKFTVNYITDWWLIEILSWCFSASCMAAIFGVLLHFDNHVLPVGPLGITINGFISLLSVFAKAALLLPTAEGLGQLKWSHFRKDSRTMMDIERIDLASRGPWGAMLLLVRTRGM